MELADTVRHLSCRIEHLEAVLETATENGWAEASLEIKQELSTLGAERYRLSLNIRNFTGVPWSYIRPYIKAERQAEEAQDE